MNKITIDQLADLIRDCIDAELDQSGSPAGRAILSMTALEFELERRRASLSNLLRVRAQVSMNLEGDDDRVRRPQLGPR